MSHTNKARGTVSVETDQGSEITYVEGWGAVTIRSAT